MGTICSFNAPPQDPIYGISRSNIADQLNSKNWRKKALCRLSQNRSVYIYIVRCTIRKNNEKARQRYLVRIHFGSKEDQAFRRDFRTLKEALDYANGEDGSELGQVTQPASSAEYPRNQDADTYISGFGANRGQANFSMKIPGEHSD